MKVRIKESVLRGIIQEEVTNYLNEGFFDRFHKTPENIVIEIGKSHGWTLRKTDGDNSNVAGVYQAAANSSYFGQTPDTSSWSAMIADLRKQGLNARGSNFHQGMEGLKPGVENPNGGMPSMFGTITIS